MQTFGEYELLEKIAEGGMGAVYKARRINSEEIVAIKILSAHLVKNPVLVKRFEKEYNAAKAIDHPHIVRALAFGSNGDTPYLVMEYVAGESLGQKLERDGKLTEAEAVSIITQIAQGLERAHAQGLIHRDVKPDNILLTPDGKAKLADLGLVKEVEADLNLTRTGRGLGTPHFMAPEQFRNAKNADVRCDIYSLGATLYMMVTGELPFKSLSPLDAWMKKVQNQLTPARELVPDLSESIDRTIRRSMASEPSSRPANCREFIEELSGQNTRQKQPANAQPVGTLWYLHYLDEDGQPHLVKGGTQTVRRSLMEGYLGDAEHIRAAKSKPGPYKPLHQYPEFQDIFSDGVLQGIPTTVEPSTKERRNTPVLTRRSSVVLQRPQASELDAHLETTAAGPHIEIAETKSKDPKWNVLILLCLIIAAALAGFFLLPSLLR